MENALKEVEDAKAKVVSAETTLASEMISLQEGEQRRAALLAEASRTSEQPPPRCPWIFAAEFSQLSLGCGAPARTGRVAVRVWATRRPHENRRGTPTEVNSVVVNTIIRSDPAKRSICHQRWQWKGRKPSALMEMGQPRESHAVFGHGKAMSDWREVRSGYGLRGVPVGEGSHPGRPDQGEGWISA